MFPSQYRLVVTWLESAVLLVLALYLSLHTLPRAWSELNTDFPNYYMSARLAHEGCDTARANEWVWLAREKDQRSLDAKVIGLLPITPFSTLAMMPLTELPALTAKRIWILLNLALLAPIGWFLHSMTGLHYRRVALLFAMSFPLHRNLLYGQFYVLLLLLIVAACWAYLREYFVIAGALVAVAAACKIFPILLFALFLQRRNWRALIAGAFTGAAAATVSVAVFGWNIHRTYLLEILPSVLHGEGLPPYATSSASISSVLHYLFLDEPQWNPHPWHASTLIYALLQPTLPMLLLAPAVLLICRRNRTRERILLEYSALIVAPLAISTIPASYDFVLLALPMCVLTATLLDRKSYGWLALAVIAYLGIGFPMPSPATPMGLAILFWVPRLPLITALLFGLYTLLWGERSSERSPWHWSHYAWLALFLVAILLGFSSTLQRERAVRKEYAYRLPLQADSLLDAHPDLAEDGLRYIALTTTGYHLVTEIDHKAQVDSYPGDDLSFVVVREKDSERVLTERVLTERVMDGHSVVLDTRDPSPAIVNDAHEPMLTIDQESLAFLHDDHGRGQLRMQSGFEGRDAKVSALTPHALNVYEATVRSRSEYAFSAVESGNPPQLYLTDSHHSNQRLPLGEARYPALSPDGRWLAYSHLQSGVWNLWIRDQQTGSIRRIAEVPCNQMEPGWQEDSKTLLYATDCGRSLWFTAIARRRVID